MTEIFIDCKGKNCPVPLVEMRKAVRKATVGDIVEIVGDHPASRKEIPMAVQSLGQELIEVKDRDGGWAIRIRKIKEG